MMVAWHGFLGTGEDLHPLRESLSLPIQTPDLVGHGTHSSSDFNDFTLEHQLNYWSDRIPPKSILLGYSMGGRLALQFALRYPERLSGLILIGATPGIQEPYERQLRQDWDRQQATKIRNEGMQSFYQYWQTLSIIETQSSIPTDVRMPMNTRRDAQDPEQAALSISLFGTGTMPHCWDILHTLSVPTLVMVGELDQKYREIASKMKDIVPELITETTISGAGHCVHLERQSASAHTISAWLSK